MWLIVAVVVPALVVLILCLAGKIPGVGTEPDWLEDSIKKLGIGIPLAILAGWVSYYVATFFGLSIS